MCQPKTRAQLKPVKLELLYRYQVDSAPLEDNDECSLIKNGFD